MTESNRTDAGLEWNTVLFRAMVALAVSSVLLCGWVWVAFQFYPCWNPEGTEGRGQFGDMFGGATALFTGAGVCAVVWQIFLQRAAIDQVEKQIATQGEELRLQREASVSDRRFRILELFMKEHQAIGEEIRTLSKFVLNRAETIGAEYGFELYRKWLELCAGVMTGTVTRHNGEEAARRIGVYTAFCGFGDSPDPDRVHDDEKCSTESLKKRLDKAISETELDRHSNGRPLNWCRRLVATFWDRLGRIVNDERTNQGDLTPNDALAYFDPGNSLPHILALTIIYARKQGPAVGHPDNGTRHLFEAWRRRHPTQDRLFFDTPKSLDAFDRWVDESMGVRP